MRRAGGAGSQARPKTRSTPAAKIYSPTIPRSARRAPPKARPAIRNGRGGRPGRPRGRRVQPRGLRAAGDHARGPSARAAHARRRQSGAAHDRPISHRSRRRGRICQRRSWTGGARSSAPASAKSRPCSRVLQGFDPPGMCARDLAECLTLQLKDRDRFDPAMQALITRLDLLAKRDFAALKKICGVGDEDLADMIARDPPAQSEARSGFRVGAWCSRSCRTCSCGRAPTAAGWSNSIPTPCRSVLVNQTYYAEVSATTRRDNEKSYLCRMPAERHLAGARARPARPHHPQGRQRNRAPAGRLLRPRRRASCARSTSRPSPKRSACTNRRCRASPPTNTWRPTAASSS